jgi:hypothetical protein
MAWFMYVPFAILLRQGFGEREARGPEARADWQRVSLADTADTDAGGVVALAVRADFALQPALSAVEAYSRLWAGDTLLPYEPSLQRSP